MREQEMRERVDRFLRARLRSIVLPSALGAGLVLAGGCRGHVQSGPSQTVSSQADAGEPVGEFSGGVAIYSAPVSADPVEPSE